MTDSACVMELSKSVSTFLQYFTRMIDMYLKSHMEITRGLVDFIRNMNPVWMVLILLLLFSMVVLCVVMPCVMGVWAFKRVHAYMKKTAAENVDDEKKDQ